MYVVTIFPYVMLTVLLVRGCTLEGASLGIEFYLKPDFDRLTDGTASYSLYFLHLSSLFISSSGSIHKLCHNQIWFLLDRIADLVRNNKVTFHEERGKQKFIQIVHGNLACIHTWLIFFI